MSLKSKVYHWLGLDMIDRHNQATRDILMQVSTNLRAYRDAVEINSRIHARIVAKLDPMYATPEDDPVRKAASDRLTDETIARIRGEFLAQERYKNG